MIRAVLFDKDGTLLEFDTLWGAATRRVLPSFLRALSVPAEHRLYERMLEALGVTKVGVDAGKAMEWMPYTQMAAVLVKALEEEGFGIKNADAAAILTKLYYKEITRPEAKIIPTGDLTQVMNRLKNRKCLIGLATADGERAAKFCLDRLKIRNYFDYIGTSGGSARPKPSSDLCDWFCRKYHLRPEEVMVVGDSPTDMEFARNSGALAVGVLSGVGSREQLQGMADVLIPSVDDLDQVWTLYLSEKSGDSGKETA